MAPTTSTRHESPTPSSDPTNATNPQEEDVTRSDGESGSEKPVREKLRDTNINQAERGRLQKKRSLEEVDKDEDEDDEGGTRHVRKRSREAAELNDEVPKVEGTNGDRSVRSGTPDTAAERADEAMEGGLTSPKGKRTRDQLLSDAKSADAPADVGTPDERRTKRAKDSATPEPATAMTEASPPKPAAASGFGNTSATSPFGALAGKKEESKAPQTSDEKFKSSGFGSFAAASASPFGSAAPKSTSPFGAAAASGAPSPWAAKSATPATQPSVFAAAASKPATSGFGNMSSTSAFGSLGGKPSARGGGSAFGGALGSGSAFGGLGGASKLSSFAGGSGPKIEGLSSKPVKAFGAADDSDEGDDEETEEDESTAGAKSPVHETEGEKDKRFYKRDLETGEEGETTMFQQRAKLFWFDKEEKKWVERGAGVLKLNISESAGGSQAEEGKPKLMDAPDDLEAGAGSKLHARLLLRADGSQRLVLNSPIQKGAKFGDETEPKAQSLVFMGRLADSKESSFDLLTMKMNAERLKALWHHVQELQEKLA